MATNPGKGNELVPDNGHKQHFAMGGDKNKNIIQALTLRNIFRGAHNILIILWWREKKKKERPIRKMDVLISTCNYINEMSCCYIFNDT